MAMGPKKITAPPLLPPEHGIVASANVGRVVEDRWLDGVTFQPTGHYSIGVSEFKCNPADLGALQPCTPWVEFFPYNLYIGVEWSSLDADDIDESLKAAIEIGTSSKLEDLMWNGDAAVPGNPTLSSATPLSDIPFSALTALSYTEQWLGSSIDKIGVRGTLYMNQLVANQVYDHFTTAEDGRLRTKIGGHLVVIGSDFHDTDDILDLRIVAVHGEPEIFLETIDNDSVTSALEEVRKHNEAVAYVQRAAMVTWDSSMMASIPVNPASVFPAEALPDDESS